MERLPVCWGYDAATRRAMLMGIVPHILRRMASSESTDVMVFYQGMWMTLFALPLFCLATGTTRLCLDDWPGGVTMGQTFLLKQRIAVKVKSCCMTICDCR